MVFTAGMEVGNVAKANEVKQNPHKNHRERVKQKYLDHGLECFADHEVLEMILFFSVPQKDTNEMAHSLIDRFGSLRGVLNATPEELYEISGVKSHSAVLLGLIRDINRRCVLSEVKKGEIFDTVSKIGRYFVDYFSGLNHERVAIMLLDNSMRFIDCVKISDGTVSGATVDYKLIAQTAMSRHATSVVLAHNHPLGVVVPSRDDREISRAVEAALSVIGINLIEHIIVNEEAYTPTMIGKYSYIRSAPCEAKMPENFAGKFYDI